MLGSCACLFASLVLGPRLRLVAADSLPVWYLDAVRGIDDDALDRGRSLAQPFRTIPHALARAAAFVVEPGYTGERGACLRFSATPMPLDVSGGPTAIPSTLERVVMEGPQGGAAVLRIGGDAGYAGRWLEVRPPADGVPRSYEFRRIAVAFGSTAMTFYPASGTPCRIVLENCRFVLQAAEAVLVPVAAGGDLSFALRDCELEQGHGGVSVLCGAESRCQVTVERCSFSEMIRYAGGKVLGAAVDVHIEDRAQTEVLVARNTFRSVGAAVQLTTTEDNPENAPSAGKLAAEIVSNVVSGSGPWDIALEDVVTNAIYLSVWPHHNLSIGVRNNTFAYLEGHVIYNDNAAYYHERGMAPPLVFANNIAWQIGASAEIDLERLALEAEPGVEWTPPSGLQVRANLLEKSQLALREVDGNFTGDPLFVSPESGQYGVPAISPVVDHGSSNDGSFEFSDVAGDCRRSGQLCPTGPDTVPAIDIGAYEYRFELNYCDPEYVPFVRGDCNRSSSLELSDAVYLFTFLFLGREEEPKCRDACDSNDDTTLNISDGVLLLNYLFSGGRALPAPFPEPGLDPTPDCHPSCR